MRLTRLSALVVSAISLVLVAGCGDEGSGKPATGPASAPAKAKAAPASAPAAHGPSSPQIAIIPCSNAGDNWQAIHAGAMKAIAEGPKTKGGKPVVDIFWQGPEQVGSGGGQLSLAQSLIKNGVAAVVISPDDGATLSAVVAAAAPQHVPVVVIESDIKAEGCRSVVKSDDRKAGELAAQELAKLLGNKGRVSIYRDAGATALTARELGFIEALKASPDIKIVSSDALIQKAGGDGVVSSGEGGTTVDGIFAPSGTATQEALHGLQDINEAGKIKLVGIDATEKLAAALKSGEVGALVLTDPFNVGFVGVKTAADCVREKKVEKRIDVPLHVATAANMDDPEIAALLAPAK